MADCRDHFISKRSSMIPKKKNGDHIRVGRCTRLPASGRPARAALLYVPRTAARMINVLRDVFVDMVNAALLMIVQS